MMNFKCNEIREWKVNSMKRREALVFSFEEFNALCNKIFDGNTFIVIESGEWSWVSSEEITEEYIEKNLENYFQNMISGFYLSNIYVDANDGTVIII